MIVRQIYLCGFMPHTKLTEDAVRGMRAMRANGALLRVIAAAFGVSMAVTSRVLRGTRWGYVQ